MASIMLKFIVSFESYHGNFSNHGPLFHRWLPEGNKDAITIDTGNTNVRLSIWFERFSSSSNGQIKVDSSTKDIDSNLISTHAIVNGGPLFGLLEIDDVTDEEVACIKDDKIGSADYIKIAKRVIDELIYPRVNAFIEVLRVNYGQFWLRCLDKWDSRKESLGSYCSDLQLKCSIDGGVTWKKFEPDKNVTILVATINNDFSGYLTEADWKSLSKVVQEYEPSFARKVLSRAHQYADEGNLKYAFIEGVTALELSINELAKMNIGDNSQLMNKMGPFWDLPLKVKLLTVTAASGKIPIDLINNAIDAINIRNEIVHKAAPLHPNAKIKLLDLLTVTARLLSGPVFRFLSANPGNLTQSIEDWEKTTK